MNCCDIRKLLPHAPPMVLIDRVVAASPDELRAELTIRPTCLFYRDGQVPGWVGVEYMAQAVAAHEGFRALSSGEPIKPGLLLGARRYSTDWPAFPDGSTIQISARPVLIGDDGLGSFECKIWHNHVIIASASLIVYQPGDFSTV